LSNHFGIGQAKNENERYIYIFSEDSKLLFIIIITWIKVGMAFVHDRLKGPVAFSAKK
jgi:hypothetical protein